MGLTAVILPALIFVLLIIGWFFARVIIYPKRFGVQETYDLEKEAGKLIEGDYNSWIREEIWITSEFGYLLHGFYFPIEGANRSIIFSHGITYTLYGSVKYMSLFRDLGFNILIYDNRFHGLSGGKNCTFGYYEKIDLKTITTWLVKKTGADSIIGTHGESMGAAISLQHAAIDDRIKFIISDCSFSNLVDQLSYRLRIEYHLPGFPFIALSGIMARWMSGMVIHEVSPVNAAEQIYAPILFIHGANDDFIPVSMVQQLIEHKTNGPRKHFLAPGAGHAESYWSNPIEYSRIVREFLMTHQIIK